MTEPLDLKILLLRKGITHASIAARLGVSAQLVGAVVRMEKRSLRVESEIANMLHRSIESLFGEPQRARRGSSHTPNVQKCG